MNLVKWFRKNNTKLMAIVVIVLMIGFVGGSSLTYLLRGRGDINKVVAYYGNDIGIKRYDLMVAQRDLDILKALQAGTILKAFQEPLEDTPNLHALVLGELLFSEQRPTPQVIAYIQRTAGEYQFRINNKQINDLYELNAPSYYYWFLLDKEAQSAGFKVQNEASRNVLSRAVPEITGQNYSQFIEGIMISSKISEDKILAVFSKLLAILQYSHAACSGQDITISQLKHFTAAQREGLDIEFVRFSSEKFIDKQETPTEQQITEQFEKFKQFLPDEVTGENPCGFGYKLPDRVQLEYIAMKLDDIKKIVKKPTFDEQSQFYNNNKDSKFTVDVKPDPNASYLEKKTRTKLFSEVADEITEYLIQEKVTQKAISIFHEARILADGSLQDIKDVELDKLSMEEREKRAGEYTKVAEQLRSKYNIEVYQGLTGELSAEDIQSDKLLSQLYIEGYVSELGLAKVAFDVEQFKMNLLGSYETIRPKMYVSIEPFKDKSLSGKIMAMVRVVKAIESSIPENVDLTYSKKPFIVDPNEEDTEQDTFSMRENVTKDLKRLAAMDTAKAQADELLEMTAASQDEQVWENVVEKFNELYEQEYPDDPNLSQPEDSNEPPFKLEKLDFLRRLTKDTLLTITQDESNPLADRIKNLFNKESQFLDVLFSKVPRDSNSPEPMVIEFKPDLSYYVVKSISLNPLWKEDYERMRSLMSYRKDMYETQSLAFEQFNPANIFERMRFRAAEEKEEITNAEPNEPEE